MKSYIEVIQLRANGPRYEPCKPDDGDKQMKEKDNDLAHPCMVPNPKNT
jgi:hypothetical protein